MESIKQNKQHKEEPVSAYIVKDKKSEARVLAGELTTQKNNLQAGLKNYEKALNEYVANNQELAYHSNAEHQLPNLRDPDHLPDFAQSVVPFELKNYDL